VSGSNDKTVRIWDAKSHSRTPIQVLTDATDNVTGVCFAGPDVLVTACMDGSLRHYDCRMGRLLKDDTGAPVVALAVSGDCQCLLTATNRGRGGASSLSLWERATGEELAAYSGHSAPLYRSTPALTATDAFVACGGEGGVVSFWDIVTTDPTPAGQLARTPGGAEESPHAGRFVSCVDFMRLQKGHKPANMMVTASFDASAVLWVCPSAAAALKESGALDQPQDIWEAAMFASAIDL
jgi:mitogen-activated protein kinase organizer 1